MLNAVRFLQMVLYLKLLEERQLLKKLYVVIYNNDTLKAFPKDNFEVFSFNWEYLLNEDPKFFCKLLLPM